MKHTNLSHCTKDGEINRLRIIFGHYDRAWRKRILVVVATLISTSIFTVCPVASATVTSSLEASDPKIGSSSPAMVAVIAAGIPTSHFIWRLSS